MGENVQTIPLSAPNINGSESINKLYVGEELNWTPVKVLSGVVAAVTCVR